jgi:adenylate cyclase, class 2
MLLNLELKASIPSVELARVSARRCGAEFGGVLLQEDTYFRVAHGRLKLREIAGHGSELIYYERPDTSLERWSNYSTVAVTEPVGLKEQLSSALGVRVVVKKKRELFLLGGTRIHLDDVEGLGTFLEFEIPVRDELEAFSQMNFLRAQFGIDDGSIFTPSYSDLILAKTEGFGY